MKVGVEFVDSLYFARTLLPLASLVHTGEDGEDKEQKWKKILTGCAALFKMLI
jgi:hypothetical protein